MCYSPLYISTKNMSNSLLPPEQRYLAVPCGKCDDCLTNRSKEWAVKCMCEYESRIFRDTCWFLTLTYNDENVPFKLCKRDLQLFFKRIRKNYHTYSFKYFACGEYGSRTYRPHYHVICYGLPIDDLCKLKDNQFGDILYTSDKLQKIWGLGNIVIGELSLKSANYTARYCMKKISDTDCFQLSSNGFGKTYFINNMSDIISNGFISMSCDGVIVKCKIPKYYLKLYRKKIGDDEYFSFLKFRNKQYIKFQKELDKVFPDKQLRYKKHWVKIREREIGKIPYSVSINIRNKKIIQESLMDLYRFRDF